jgi:hypothetical protein
MRTTKSAGQADKVCSASHEFVKKTHQGSRRDDGVVRAGGALTNAHRHLAMDPSRAHDRASPAHDHPSPARDCPSPARDCPSPARGRPSPARGRPSPARGRPSPARGRPSPARGRPSPARDHPIASSRSPIASSRSPHRQLAVAHRQLAIAHRQLAIAPSPARDRPIASSRWRDGARCVHVLEITMDMCADANIGRVPTWSSMWARRPIEGALSCLAEHRRSNRHTGFHRPAISGLVARDRHARRHRISPVRPCAPGASSPAAIGTI